MKNYSRVYAEIDLDAIAYNFESMHRNIHPSAGMIAVIKADGYGHGAVPIARLAEPLDYIWGFAVATAEEALQLRTAGIKKPVLILGYVFEEHYEELIRADIRPVVFKLSMAEQLSKEAVRQQKNAVIHIGLDTGMTRIGFPCTAESLLEIMLISRLPNIKIEGIFTHFARADETDKTSAQNQLEHFLKFTDSLKEKGVDIPLRHCSNSAGIIDMPYANLNLVRAGISIYGIYPSEEVCKENVPLKPAMALKSHITLVKEVEAGVAVSYGGTFVTKRKTRIATIPVGYADGYPRLLSNRGRVLIHGKSAPILGRVCMDQFMVDVTEIPQAQELDAVTLLGEDGESVLSVEELGGLSGRFPYEFVCDISKRVPRVYKKNGQVSEQKDFFDVY
ncbi:alanine racemase [Marvinbryantia formatexigens DSM 14469]|uniref:Alanine racemase n=1 Tax=Marvinbryantia formatexigens DSM 14469 TaxID=478749 RepID=C6LCF4_9FIRM|nr:alanine racemase [Marvinbryantia formatexigens]EET61618.1 alanine racemase [Marvinbryantia formatexigens DSM 14469]UWO24556.1 alanine racemase [Marvinbryantia formatexigens DSM 14469]SDF13079.1 alanine racemase [Marvinbryantia formatexigens]